MRKLLTILAAVLSTAGVLVPRQASAQSPEKMSYQAVIRDTDDNLISETQVGMQISILQGSASGTTVYTETQTPTTNMNGLVSLEIGAGTVQSGEFSTIDWAEGPFFIKTETDPAGGTNYTITGTSQLLSVPYALHANEIDPSVPQGTQAGEMQYWNGTAWTIVPPGSEGSVLTFVNGVPTWEAQGSIPVGFVKNPITGRIWMDRNLGASQVATSSTDADAYGDLYQWGRASDGHQSRTSATTTTLSSSDTPGHGDFIINANSPFDWRVPQNDNLWQGVNGINNPCPAGSRLPTEAEWEIERLSWSSNDAAGAFDSPLKLTVGGIRKFSDGSLLSVGTSGGYWSSTLSDEGGGIYSRFLSFGGSNAYVISSHRASGYSVRCIKD